MTGRGRAARVRAAVAAVALAAGGGVVASTRQTPAFRAGIDVVSLAVTVTDRSGRFVTDLEPGQFHVVEDGAVQDVAYFNRTNMPVALALLLDTSTSMEVRMAAAQNAAVGFVRRMQPRDVAELVAFDRDVRIVQGFTGDQAALERAIRSTTAVGSTSLYNAVYVSLRELRKNRVATEQDVRRQGLVVVSDGEDTSSLVDFDEVLDLARRSETAIYTIGLRSAVDTGDKAFKEADYVLRRLTQETGGRAFFPARIEDLAGVYSQIADELASQYVLGYTSKNTRRDGAWRRIMVRVDRQGATARTRPGYFGPSGSR
jgi:VWFA-related protein